MYDLLENIDILSEEASKIEITKNQYIEGLRLQVKDKLA